MLYLRSPRLPRQLIQAVNLSVVRQKSQPQPRVHGKKPVTADVRRQTVRIRRERNLRRRAGLRKHGRPLRVRHPLAAPAHIADGVQNAV